MEKRKLDKAPEKVSEICRILKDEALEPAKRESHTIVEEAKNRAAQIIKEAEEKAENLILDTRKSLEQERSVFQSSLVQASKQSFEALRQSIENTLFSSELESTIAKNTSDPKVIAQIINAICAALEKEGLSGDLVAMIPNKVSADSVTSYLLDNVVHRLKNNPIELTDISGGAKVRLVDKYMTIDLSDAALKDLISRYVRKDFRELLFGA